MKAKIDLKITNLENGHSCTKSFSGSLPIFSSEVQNFIVGNNQNYRISEEFLLNAYSVLLGACGKQPNLANDFINKLNKLSNCFLDTYENNN